MMDSLEQMLATAAGSLGLGSIILIAITVFLRTRPDLLKIRSEGDASMRDDLFERIRLLEGRVEGLQDKLEQERKSHEKELRLLRHRLNGETQTLDALLMLIRAAPDKLLENVDMIVAQRNEQKRNMAAERGVHFTEMTEETGDAGPA